MTTPEELIARAREIHKVIPVLSWEVSNWFYRIQAEDEEIAALNWTSQATEANEAARVSDEAKALCEMSVLNRELANALELAQANLAAYHGIVEAEQWTAKRALQDLAELRHELVAYKRDVGPVVEAVRAWQEVARSADLSADIKTQVALCNMQLPKGIK